MQFLTAVEYEFILRRDLTSFIERSFFELNPQAHLLMSSYIEMIATQLEACRLGRIRRLIINLPPRHLKSHCASIAFPAWYLGHNPAGHVICASYGQALAEKLARDCRIVMQSRWYQLLFPTRLSDRQAVHDFATTAQGTRMATSVEGPLTGRGADMIIIDDPLKPEEALSESRRKTVNQWYDNTVLSRLNDKANGCLILVMQRLHQDDLVGHVLEQEDWEVLSFPAIAEDDEVHVIESPLGRRCYQRKAGDILHPERESRATLAAIRQTMSEYNFFAQYQQNPVPLGGVMVKSEWLKRYEVEQLPERFSCTIQSWDSANKAGEFNDFSVCTTWGVYDGHYYLLDVFRRRLNFPELKRAVREQAQKSKPDAIVIEDRASGTQLIQDLSAEGLYGIKPYAPPPATDKVVRLYAQTAEFEGGRVLLPRTASWLDEYIRELTAFPNSKYDDQVDSTAQALDYLKKYRDLEIWARLGRD